MRERDDYNAFPGALPDLDWDSPQLRAMLGDLGSAHVDKREVRPPVPTRLRFASAPDVHYDAAILHADREHVFLSVFERVGEGAVIEVDRTKFSSAALRSSPPWVRLRVDEARRGKRPGDNGAFILKAHVLF